MGGTAKGRQQVGSKSALQNGEKSGLARNKRRLGRS